MISAVVLTKNCQNQIINCIKSLLWCDEVIIIDDNSIDNTVSLAKNFGAKVYIRGLGNDFSSQRNFALEKAKGDWIFFVDSDEIVDSKLQAEILLSIKSATNSGYLLKRTDTMWKKPLYYGENGNIYHLRLGKKNSGKWVGDVHETWIINGKIGKLLNSLKHYPHQTIKDFLQEINFYTSIRANELYLQHKKVNAYSIILYPQAKFIINFFIKSGYKDKMPGLIVAVLMSFHSFLVRAKLWQLWKKQTTH